MITSPSTKLPVGGYMSLLYDRKHVRIRGKVSTRIAKRMLDEGKLQGRFVDLECSALFFVDVELSGQSLAAANATNVSQDLLYEIDKGWQYRKVEQPAA
ncbi:MAG: hypothetical protein AAFR97_08065 [Bacteroidota bacterium]